MIASVTSPRKAWTAFDGIAEEYDQTFTNSLVGRAQRATVWNALDRFFSHGQTVLELNCGTGEDALHLANRGVRVVACDVSPRMVAVARQKAAPHSTSARTQFRVMPTETISELSPTVPFDGAFSNFAGLNCVEDLVNVADQLACLVRPGAWMLLCFYSKCCLWEMVHYALCGEWRKAFRRWRRSHIANVGGATLVVRYPSVGELERIFSPWFRLCETTAVGLVVPPSYRETWCREHPRLFRGLVWMDKLLRSLPVLRGCGDHVLLALQRRDA